MQTFSFLSHAQHLLCTMFSNENCITFCMTCVTLVQVFAFKTDFILFLITSHSAISRVAVKLLLSLWNGEVSILNKPLRQTHFKKHFVSSNSAKLKFLTGISKASLLHVTFALLMSLRKNITIVLNLNL